MDNRTLIAVIGISAFAGTVAVGVIVIGRGSENGSIGGGASSAPASTAAVAAATTSAPQTTAAPTTAAPTTTVPKVVVRCGETYIENDVLPLRPCDKGYGVQILQESLSWLGAAIDIDGYYGQDTTDAVLDFQARSGLPPTGEADAATWLAIVGERPGFDLDGDGVVGPNEIAFD